MLTAKRKVGNLGEDLACRFLEEKGYKIVERNFLTREGEIDIIAEQNNQLVFIEVKTRSTNFFGYPEEFVKKDKVQKMLKAIRVYLAEKYPANILYTLDIIAVELKDAARKAKVTHFKNILY